MTYEVPLNAKISLSKKTSEQPQIQQICFHMRKIIWKRLVTNSAAWLLAYVIKATAICCYLWHPFRIETFVSFSSKSLAITGLLRQLTYIHLVAVNSIHLELLETIIAKTKTTISIHNRIFHRPADLKKQSFRIFWLQDRKMQQKIENSNMYTLCNFVQFVFVVFKYCLIFA